MAGGTDYQEILRHASEISRHEPGVVRFRTDAAMVRRLGRELVAKQETALGELVKNAYDADAIDHRHYGESGGAPRQWEHWPSKVSDLRAALDWMESRPEIDPGRLAAVGVCLGAGYAGACGRRR